VPACPESYVQLVRREHVKSLPGAKGNSEAAGGRKEIRFCPNDANKLSVPVLGPISKLV
jgi:hypothetical protein